MLSSNLTSGMDLVIYSPFNIFRTVFEKDNPNLFERRYWDVLCALEEKATFAVFTRVYDRLCERFVHDIQTEHFRITTLTSAQETAYQASEDEKLLRTAVYCRDSVPGLGLMIGNFMFGEEWRKIQVKKATGRQGLVVHTNPPYNFLEYLFLTKSFVKTEHYRAPELDEPYRVELKQNGAFKELSFNKEWYELPYMNACEYACRFLNRTTNPQIAMSTIWLYEFGVIRPYFMGSGMNRRGPYFGQGKGHVALTQRGFMSRHQPFEVEEKSNKAVRERKCTREKKEKKSSAPPKRKKKAAGPKEKKVKIAAPDPPIFVDVPTFDERMEQAIRMSLEDAGNGNGDEDLCTQMDGCPHCDT
jgi:hypothetical protein